MERSDNESDNEMQDEENEVKNDDQLDNSQSIKEEMSIDKDEDVDQTSNKDENEDQTSNKDEEEDQNNRDDKEENSDESENEDNHSIKSSDNEDKLRKIKEANEIFGNSDSENDDEDDIINTNKKRKAIISSDDDDDEDNDESNLAKKKKKTIESDEDSNDANLNKAKADDSGDEEVNANKDDQNNENNKVLPDISSDSSDDELEDDRRQKRSGDLVYDFDIMMAKKKEQNAKNRRRKNTDIINDSDDFINDLIEQMKQACSDDFALNNKGQAATRKMKLLPQVHTYLRKIDLREPFLDLGVLNVIADWLTRLPDGSLPNLQVRETLLKILIELNIMDVDRLKSSGIGRSVMYLFKHPKETKENKRRAQQLITNWSKYIFNCETDYHSISKEDREQRDYDLMNRSAQQRKSSSQINTSQSSNSNQNEQASQLKPGDKGWVSRARVPLPSTKVYLKFIFIINLLNIKFQIYSSNTGLRCSSKIRYIRHKKR